MLKKMNMTPINGIEEVNIFKESGEVIHITNPKSNHSIILFLYFSEYIIVQASVPSNTYVVNGNVEHKTIQSLMPGVLPQLSQEMLNQTGGSMQGGAANEEEEEEDDDEDIPELVENFEDVSKK